MERKNKFPEILNMILEEFRVFKVFSYVISNIMLYKFESIYFTGVTLDKKLSCYSWLLGKSMTIFLVNIQTYL